MCGIAGIFHARDEHPVDPTGLDRMAGALAHRGPDGSGVWIDGPVGFGHRRLAIIDLSGGAQPMASPDTGAVITFNGEIYNYRELQRELTALGVRFGGPSDTEVVLRAYERWGRRSIERLRGMFAFAIWDPRERALFAARDRLGIKPFYYRWDGRTLVFASELKAFVALGDRPLDVDEDSFAEYLRLQYIPGPATIFRGIRHLGPGRTLRCSAAGLDEARYWRPAASDAAPADDVGELRAELQNAVDCHLVSDVPVGAFLSGGIDSSLIVSLMARRAAQPLKTFSIGFDGGDEFDERPSARLVADRFGTEHHERLVTDRDAVAALPRVAARLDEPLADYAILPTFLLAEEAAREVKVVLTGEGADELFGGYRRYRARRLPAAIAALGGAYQATHLFSPREVARLTGGNGHCRASPPQPEARDPLTATLVRDLEGWLADDLLVKLDRMTMLCSLEARVPYLDHHLVEFALRVPGRRKVSLLNGRRKVLMREAAADLLPPAIVKRPKHGFTPPVNRWLQAALGTLARDALLDSSTRLRARVDRRELERLLAEQARGRRRGHQIWSLLVYELWSRHVGIG